MPLKDNKEFSETAEGLESLADGIKKHSGEPNFPPTLVEAATREKKVALEDKRETFEKSDAKANQDHVVYKDELTGAKEYRASAQRALQAFYGLRSQTLKDFGFQPPKPGGKKGPRTPK